MIKLASIVISAFALTVIVRPVLATSVVFAEYDRADNSQFSLVSTPFNNGDSYTVVISGGGQISFSYLIGGTEFGFTPQLATLDFTATTTLTGSCSPGQSCIQDHNYTESGYSGSFRITSVSTFSNLLSGTFNLSSSLLDGATLSSVVGGNTGTLQASTTSSNPNQITFTSDFLDFANSVTRDATFSLSALSPNFSVITTSLTSKFYPSNFLALGSGVFSEDLAVPEPSTFALLASALLGVCLWQRKRRQLHR